MSCKCAMCVAKRAITDAMARKLDDTICNLDKQNEIHLNCGHVVKGIDEAVKVEYVEDGGLVFAAFCKDCAAESWLVEAELEAKQLKKKWGIE